MSFIFGGNTGQSYADLQGKRRVVQSLMKQPKQETAMQGFLDGIDEFADGMEGREGEDSLLNGLFGKSDKARTDHAGHYESPYAAQNAARAQTGTNIGTMQQPDPAEWLRYANQGATRNKPLSDKMTTTLGSILPGLGVQMEVFSGGQDAKGHGHRRTGSTRHDHGNAADAFFYKDGRKLDWANAQDRPIFEEIVRQARGGGLTGFGAGDGYMQSGSMHIGYGAPSVWGAGGKGANAPDWLRRAFEG